MLLLKYFNRIKPIYTQILFPGTLSFNFAKLPSVVDIKKSEQEEKFQGYYEDVLRMAKTSKSGRIHVETHHLSTLIDKVQTKKEFDLLLDAYYNFIGNAANFKNIIVDKLVKKGLGFEKTVQLTPLIANHNFLYYYPAPEILTLFLETVEKQKRYDLVVKFLKIFNEQRMLKPDVRAYEIMISETLRTKHYKNILKILSLLHRREFRISTNSFEKLVDSFINYYKPQKRFRISEKKLDKIKQILNPDHEKPSGVFFRLAWLYILSESHGALSYSFLFLEDYTKKLASETDNENSKNLALFPNTPHFIDYFAYLEKRLQQENNPRYYLKFDQFFSDFETKYTNSRIAPELLPIITAYREKYVAKANDIKEKLPGLIEEEREKLKQKILLRNEKLKAKEMERQMKLEEKRDEMQLAREKKQREKQDNKAKTVDELSDHPLDYTWVEMRKRKDKKKVVEDPITKEKKTVVVSNKKNEEFNSGVYYRR